MNLRTIQKALNMFILCASMLIPAKTVMGQVWFIEKELLPANSFGFTFTKPSGVLMHSNGSIFVSDGTIDNPDSNRIFKFDSTGNLLKVFGTFGYTTGKLCQPQYLEEGPNGTVLVSNFGSSKIQMYSQDGEFLSEFGSKGSGDGELDNPRGLLYLDGQIYVVDSGNHRIQVFTSDGTYSYTLSRDIWDGQLIVGQIIDPVDIAYGVRTIRLSLGDGRILEIVNNKIQHGRDIPEGTRGLGLGSLLTGTSRIGIDTMAVWSLGKLSINNITFQPQYSFSGPTLSQGFDISVFWPRLVVSDIGSGRVLLFHLNDSTPPWIDFVGFDPAKWYSDDVRCEVRNNDNLAGTRQVYVDVNPDKPTGKHLIDPNPVWLSENGENIVYYWAVDWMDNVTPKFKAVIKVDKTRPIVDAFAIGSLVTVIAQDTFSGVASTKVSIDGAAEVDYTGSFIVAPGAHTVTYWATDQAGNESTREVILVGVSVSTVTIAPTTLFSTKAGVGTVKLSLAAPAGGVVVMLDSNSAAVTVPVSVTVPAGALTATFPVTANTVSTDTKAVITASVGGQEVHGTVYVLVPFPKTLTVAPTTIIGGDAAVATVTLASSAGVGGQVVNLASSNANVVVPSTVTVPAGALSATFPVQTSIVNRDIGVAISADADGTGITTTVLVKRVAPKSITFAPASVVGGNSSVATLTVTKPAPAGGIVVDLRSVSSNVSVPATVTIPEGATTATFPVTTIPVKKSESAMIQAYAAGVKVSANITVTATSVVSVTLNPAIVVGGLNSTGTITLNGNAPIGGTTVQLYCTNAAAGVPSSVVVPGGSKTVTFPITTVPVASNTTATIAAKYLGTIKSAALTVAAPTVNTLTLSPSSLTGGATSKLTIKLTGKAATVGVVVTLTSSNTVVAQLPASVMIPAGSDTVDVTITTAAVAATTNVTLTAKTGTVSKTAVLTVNK